jgi:hypothetical protein
MKIKGFIILFVFILLILPSISAVEFNVNSNFKQGETILTRISGNFITPPTKENIFFYEGHIRIPMEYDIANIQGDYYFYTFLSGKSQGNYSISIENVKYMKGSEVSQENIVRNFSITNETAAFSLKPGFVLASGNFYLEVQNLLDKQITIEIDTASNNSGRDIIISASGSKESSVSLKSGEIKKINFELGTGNSSFQQIELSSGNLNYKVPVYVSASSQQAPDSTTSTQKFEPSELIYSIPTNLITKRIIFLYNIGNKEMKNISLSLSDEISPFVNLSSYYIETLGANNNLPIELFFFSAGETEVEGTLKANINGEKMIYSSIALKFLNDYVPVNESEQSYVETCAELQGKICASTESCDKESVYAKDNVCCLGACKSTEKKGSGRILIAIGIFVVIAAGLFWFYKKKYKKAKKPVDLLDIAKEKKD